MKKLINKSTNEQSKASIGSGCSKLERAREKGFCEIKFSEDDMFQTKFRKGGRNKKFFVIISATIVTALMIAGFGLSIGNGKTEKIDFFIVTKHGEKDKDKALGEGVVVKARGGAGNLIPKNGKYFVALSCYNSSDDANIVAKNLKDVEIIKETIEIDSTLSIATIQRLGIEISNSIYALSVKFDKGEISASGLKNKLETMKNQLESIYQKNQEREAIIILNCIYAIDNLLMSNESFLNWNLKNQRIRILIICKEK